MANIPLRLEERKIIKKKLDAGYSIALIAKVLNRAKNTVVVEVRRNGGRENYDPDKAHSEALSRQRGGNAKKIIILKTHGKSPWIKIRDRISNLEMQVEILTEEIRNLKNAN